MTVVASVLMGVALWFSARELSPWLSAGQTIWTRAGALAILVIGGGLVYAIAAFATGALRLSALRGMVRRGR